CSWRFPLERAVRPELPTNQCKSSTVLSRPSQAPHKSRLRLLMFEFFSQRSFITVWDEVSARIDKQCIWHDADTVVVKGLSVPVDQDWKGKLLALPKLFHDRGCQAVEFL